MRFLRGLSTLPFYGVDALNRVSFLRSDAKFIKTAITSPHAKYIMLNNYYPLISSPTTLARASYKSNPEIAGIVDRWLAQDGAVPTPATQIIFLGLSREPGNFRYGKYSGDPYFALDVTKCDIGNFEKNVADDIKLVNQLSNSESSIYSQAKMYLDWIHKHKHCSQCGSSNYAVHAGNLLKCTNTSCESHVQVINTSFPRTDPACISAVLNQTRDEILLVRGRRKTKMFGLVAGFVEPSETIEQACKREVWEETGVHVDHVEVVGSQPWPYPSNLMIGCVGIASDTTVDLTHDNELLDAKWFKVCDIAQVVRYGHEDENGHWTLGDISIPNSHAIANILLHHCTCGQAQTSC